MKVAMLLLAAGKGTRFGGEVPKVYLPLLGEAVLVRSARRLVEVCSLARGEAELLIAVASEDREAHVRPLLPALTALGARIVEGGRTRQESMARCLAAASSSCDFVLVHDAARPLFPVAAAKTCVQRASEVGAALLAIPTPDTLKRVAPDGFVRATIDRRDVHCAQTPQVVRRDLLQRALQHAAAHKLEATDDVGLVEAVGGRVAVVAGSPRNLKITTPDDLRVAAALLQDDAKS